MSIEVEIFKKTKFNKDKLLAYGFKEELNGYKYSKDMSNGFIANLFIDASLKLIGKIIDTSLGEEYTNYRIESLKGEFVNSIREEYIAILSDIANQCCEKLYFITPQANRISEEIIKLLDSHPEFLWESFPDYAIFRYKTNQKWFAVIAYVDRSKLDKKASGMLEILNLKIKEEELEEVLTQEGFYNAWHMNKKSWITLTLDETIPDIEVMEYVKKSFIYTS